MTEYPDEVYSEKESVNALPVASGYPYTIKNDYSPIVTMFGYGVVAIFGILVVLVCVLWLKDFSFESNVLSNVSVNNTNFVQNENIVTAPIINVYVNVDVLNKTTEIKYNYSYISNNSYYQYSNTTYFINNSYYLNSSSFENVTD